MKSRTALSLTTLLVLVLALAIILAACGTPAPSPSPSPTASPKPSPSPTVSPSPTASPKPTASPSPTAPAAKEVTLTAISPWLKQYTQNNGFFKWIDYVNEKGKGIVQIRNIGGPEVIANLDQFEANRKGIVDIALTAGGYHMGIVPESQFLSLTPWPTPAFPDNPKRERDSGLTQLMTDVYRTQGIQYLGRTLLYSPIETYMKQPLNKPSDLKGRKLRSLGRYNPTVEQFGGVPVVIMEGEMYTALQSGVIEGLVHSLFAMWDFKWYDFAKYRTPENWFEQDAWVQMNLNKWNTLSAQQQKFIIDSFINYAEPELAVNLYKGMVDDVLKKLTDAGLKTVAFSPEDSKLWRESVVNNALKDLKAKAKPEFYDRFIAILNKAKS